MVPADIQLMLSFFPLSDDDYFSLLKSRFCKDGRGRRKDVPRSMATSNRHLLQLYSLKQQTKSSWEKVEGWVTYLHPHYPKGKARYLIEKTVAGVIKCPAVERDKYYQQQHDLDKIGKFIQQLHNFLPPKVHFLSLFKVTMYSWLYKSNGS